MSQRPIQWRAALFILCIHVRPGRKEHFCQFRTGTVVQRCFSFTIDCAGISPGGKQGFGHSGCMWTEQRSLAGFEPGIHIQSALYKYSHAFSINRTVQCCITTNRNGLWICPGRQ
mgnify:CR=1 FL=1